jgi:PiT family inorganic phosphate transporter
VVGAVVGIAIYWAIQSGSSFGSSLNWSKMGEVALGWVISPVFGFLGAYGFQYLVSKFITSRQKGLDFLEDTEKGFIYFLVIAVSWTQISRGGNDSANALGIMYGLLDAGELESSWKSPLLIVVGIVLAAGLYVIGKNVIKNVGQNLIEMRPSDAFSIQISTSIVIFVSTMLALPVSGSHILIFAVIGAGRVKGQVPDKKSFRKMVKSWVLTFPIAAILSGLLYWGFDLIFL